MLPTRPINRFDPAPHVPASGKIVAGDQSSAAKCVQADLQAIHHRAPTPEPQRKYRNSYQQQPGLRFSHEGFVGQKLPDSETRYGVRTALGERVGDCINPPGTTATQDFLNEQKEAVYHSRKREPVGSTFLRGHELPAKTRDLQAFQGFGISTRASETAGSLIHFQVPDEPAFNPNARGTTHHTTERDVTGQIDRRYDWQTAGVDPQIHRFGKTWTVSPDEEGGVATALVRPEANHQTVLIRRSQEEVRRGLKNPLGRARNVKDAIANLPEDFPFGKEKQKDSRTSADCMRGQYSIAEQMPDRDLGHSTRKLKNLQQIPVEDTRRYGIPSIRTDRNLPYTKSVANAVNWGDELDAKGLLYPSKYDLDGVGSQQFSCPRGLREIKTVFDRMGSGLSDEEAQRVADIAQAEFGVLSIDTFRHVYNNGPSEQSQPEPAPQTRTFSNPMDAYRGVVPQSAPTRAAPDPSSSSRPSSRRESNYRKTPGFHAVDEVTSSRKADHRDMNKVGIEVPYRNASGLARW
jgi:hypothetical protein